MKLDVLKRFAIDLANLSHCKRLKVGCIIFPPDFSAIYSIGYNGPPSGLPNDNCYAIPGECGCVHAEANALIKLGNVKDAIMLATTAPCIHCAGLIVNSKKIEVVWYIHEYRISHSILLEGGVDCDRI